MSILAEHSTLLLTMVCLFGFLMAWGVGANDVANAMGTSVGSHAITLGQALVIAAIFEFLGAYLAGGAVTDTISKGIIDTNYPVLQEHPELMVFGMISALLSTASWLLLASRLGWPVSTTHSIIGAIIGFATVGISPEAVNWAELTSVVGSWVITPLISGCIAFVLFTSIQKLILNTDEPFKNAQKFIPMYVFFLGFIVVMVTTSEGLSHIGVDLTGAGDFLVSVIAGVIVAFISRLILVNIKEDRLENRRFAYSSVERLFGYMMIFTACSMAFAHGSNDVANAVGPVAAVVSIVKSGVISAKTVLPQWVLIMGGVGIVIGLATYGYRVIATIGKNITELTPSRGFAAEISAAATVILSSGVGLPISTTQTLVGAVLGVGMARGIAALNMQVVGRIFVSWVVTLPAGALFSIIIFKVLLFSFG